MHRLLPDSPDEAFLTTLDVAHEVGLGDEDLLRIYAAMSLIRQLDHRILSLQRQGRVGFYGFATGEEGAVIGSALALRSDDWVFPAFRQGGAALLLGLPLTAYVAQCLGTSEDTAYGRQRPGLFTALEPRFVSSSSCVGNQLPQAAGAGIAARLRGDDSVILAYLGDGATSEADFHVALDFAAVYRARTVFFCQNNQWAISLPSSRQTASESIAIKSEAYGMPGIRVDGNDPLAVYDVTSQAVERARGGEGPTLIEAVTYRLGAHATSDDPDRYRAEAEVAEWSAKDPMARMRAFLTGTGLWNDEKEEALSAEITAEIDAAFESVEGAPPPPVETLFSDVYAELPLHLRIQQHELLQQQADRNSRGN
jgi:pyruvate dehydrogenase E1 component alpha subunit/2-oxoisovalerate dehydrogenase E1 component alpha subunit